MRRTAAVLISALSFLAVPGLAHADPVTAALTTWLVTNVGMSVAVASFLVNTAFYTAGSATKSRWFGKGQK